MCEEIPEVWTEKYGDSGFYLFTFLIMSNENSSQQASHFSFP